jgi:hypothetical protein
MEEAVKWYEAKVPELKLGAEAGDPDAMYHLAQRYRKGREVPQDLPRAVDWLLRAADLGHAHAQSSMGVRYYYGEGVPKNHRLAMKWYLAGAAKREPEALYNVADLFDDSDEILKNPVECCAWMLVAAAYGYMSALGRVDPLVKGLSAENLDLVARRGAQIFARCEAGQPLDPSPVFREAKPLPYVPYGEKETPPTRLSLLVEFAYRCETEQVDQVLMHELINGETPLYVLGEPGDETDPAAPQPDPGHKLIHYHCRERLVDGSYGLLAFTDYQKLCAYQKEGPCLETPSGRLVEMMDKIGTLRFILNSGTPACYMMSRRNPQP